MVETELVSGQFNDSFYPVADGVANAVRNYAYWLNRKFGKSYVVTPSCPGYEDREEFEVLRYLSVPLPLRRPYRVGLPLIDVNLRKKIRKIPFKILHAHCPFTSGLTALQLAREKHIPIVATFHSKFYDDFKEALKTEALAQFGVRKVIDFFNAADEVWTVNESTVETLRSYGYRKNIEVVHNGTDFTPPSNSDEMSKLADKHLGTSCNDIILLFVGQHIWQKNTKMLLHSLFHLKKMGVNYKMVFAGEGAAAGELRQLSRELGLEDCVRFLGVILDRNLLKSLYARASLFLFPSLYDNAPIVVKEAAAVKCPAVLIKGSNSSEGIKDDYNGFLSENDPLIYAKRIQQVLADKEHLAKVGETARKTVFRSWEQVVDEVGQRYAEIIRTYRALAH